MARLRARRCLLAALLAATLAPPPSADAFHCQSPLLRTRRRAAGPPFQSSHIEERRRALHDDHHHDDDDDDDDERRRRQRRRPWRPAVPASLSVRGGRRRTLSSLSGEGGDVRALLLLAGPVLLSGMVDPFLSVVDTAYCGRLGPAALASLGPCVSLFHLSFNMFGSVCGTTTALISQALSAPDTPAESASNSSTIIDAVVVGSDYDDAIAQTQQSASTLTTPTTAGAIATMASSSSSSSSSSFAPTTPAAAASRKSADARSAAAAELAAQSLLLSGAVGCLISVLLLAHGTTFLHAMGLPVGSPLLPPAQTYLRTRALASPAFLCIMAMEGIFRGHSDTRAPLLATLVAAITNLVLDPLLMFGPLHLGLAGAAAATAAAQYAAAAVYIVMLHRRRASIRIGLPDLQLPSLSSAASSRVQRLRQRLAQLRAHLNAALPTFKKIIAANGALLMRTMSLMLCWAVASSQATRMGAVHAAAHQVTLSIWLTLALVAEAPGIAGQILTARLVGAGQVGRARRMAGKLLAFNAALGLGLGLLLRGLVAGGLAAAMAPGAREVQAVLATTLPVCVAMQPLVAATLALEGVLVGAGEFRFLGASMLISTAAAAKLLLGASSGGIHGAVGVRGIWSGGITALFALRLTAAVFRLADPFNGPLRSRRLNAKAAA